MKKSNLFLSLVVLGAQSSFAVTLDDAKSKATEVAQHAASSVEELSSKVSQAVSDQATKLVQGPIDLGRLQTSLGRSLKSPGLVITSFRWPYNPLKYGEYVVRHSDLMGSQGEKAKYYVIEFATKPGDTFTCDLIVINSLKSVYVRDCSNAKRTFAPIALNFEDAGLSALKVDHYKFSDGPIDSNTLAATLTKALRVPVWNVAINASVVDLGNTHILARGSEVISVSFGFELDAVKDVAHCKLTYYATNSDDVAFHLHSCNTNTKYLRGVTLTRPEVIGKTKPRVN